MRTHIFNDAITSLALVQESNSGDLYIYSVHLNDLGVVACLLRAILSLSYYSPRIVTGSFAPGSGNLRLIAQNHRYEMHVRVLDLKETVCSY